MAMGASYKSSERDNDVQGRPPINSDEDNKSRGERDVHLH